MWRRGDKVEVDKLLRMLAKNSIARFHWVCNKELSSSFFPADMNNWSLAHLLFTNWCMFYDAVYEDFERPPERIIEDDKKLDEWQKYQREQREMKFEENYSSVGFKDGGISAYRADEVYVVEEGTW